MQIPLSITIPLDGAVHIPLKDIPSTGYLWHATIEGDAAVAQLIPSSPPKATPDAPIGGEGIALLKVSALHAGQAVLHLRHARPWLEQDPDEKRFTIPVQVGCEQQVS